MNTDDKKWIIAALNKTIKNTSLSSKHRFQLISAHKLRKASSKIKKKIHLLAIILITFVCLAIFCIGFQQIKTSLHSQQSKKVKHSPDYAQQKLALMHIQRQYKKMRYFKEFGNKRNFQKITKQLSEAISYFVERFPNFPYQEFLYLIKAETILLQGNYIYGKAILERIISTFPDSHATPTAYLFLGVFSEKQQNDIKKAIQNYKKALKLINRIIKSKSNSMDQLLSYYAQPRIQSSMELLVQKTTNSFDIKKTRREIIFKLHRALKKNGDYKEAKKIREKFLIKQSQKNNISFPLFPESFSASAGKETVKPVSNVQNDTDLKIIHFDTTHS